LVAKTPTKIRTHPIWNHFKDLKTYGRKSYDVQMIVAQNLEMKSLYLHPRTTNYWKMLSFWTRKFKIVTRKSLGFKF